MQRVAVFGAAGRMGAEVCRAVAAADDLELVAAVDPAAAGRPLAEVAGIPAGPLVVAASAAEIAERGVEVAVDFTHGSAAPAHLHWCADNGVHVVSGTTGLAAGETARLRERFSAPEAPNAIMAPNFAISAVLLARFAEIAARHLEGVEIIELHHASKRDAPSGTALDTARRIAAARERAGGGPFAPDPTLEERLPGSRGALGPEGIRIHAVRLPGLVAHQEVIFGALGQALTIRQDSFERTSFMPGVLLAVRRVPLTPGFTLGLEAILAL